ncbi:MAG TPA: precorrin-6A synthase (deacetylating) [Hyphomicrobium sp.]|jgi:precorrin-6A synthase
MKRVLVIGIGAGGADLLTVQAIDALNEADVIFTFDKGAEKGDLVQLRREVCERYRRGKPYSLVEVPSPPRDASAPSYKSGVAAWHKERAENVSALIRDAVPAEGCGAFLVWGDPAFYDSTLRILEAIATEGAEPFEYEVIPGISSIQLLAARHRIPLNAIGEPVLLTTGRKIAEAFPQEQDSVVVLLENGGGLESLAGHDVEIFWGAYLGTKDEVLIAGRVADVLEDILRVRRARRAEKGWIMDTYLLRRRRSA